MKVTEDQLMASLCRDSFYDFVREFWEVVVPETPVWNWHIEFICSVMQEAAERVFKKEPKRHDIVINVPPGTSKSTICSVMFPAWTWTRMPTARHICASYSFPLAVDLGRKSRDVVQSDKYLRLFPEIKIRDDQNTRHYFQNTRGGTRYSVGVNGSILGMHAHFINIDDPIDPNQVASEAERRMTNNWLRETLPSRKVDKSTALSTLIMQRLHQDDPTALFLERGDVRHVCLPAELVGGDREKVSPQEMKFRYRGGLLDPVRLNRQVLTDYQKNGDYVYSSQFLQTPIPPGGGMFKVARLKYGTAPPYMKRVARFWDKAGTADGRGAYTCGVKLGLDEAGRVWVLDVVRFRKDTYEREKTIKEVAKQDGKLCPVGLEQEGGSGGKESAGATAKNLLGHRVIIKTVGRSDGDKEARAEPFSSQVNAGNVYLQTAAWNDDYLDEMTFFPFSRYKDQIDASAGAFSLLSRERRRAGPLRKTVREVSES